MPVLASKFASSYTLPCRFVTTLFLATPLSQPHFINMIFQHFLYEVIFVTALHRVFCAYSQSIKVNVDNVPKNRPQVLHFTPYSNQHFQWTYRPSLYDGVSISFRTGRLGRELQQIQLSATRCSCIAILWVSLVSFAAITLCVASQRVFIVIVYFVIDTVRNFWIQPRIINLLSTLSSSRM
jgi:hypothetical protein